MENKDRPEAFIKIQELALQDGVMSLFYLTDKNDSRFVDGNNIVLYWNQYPQCSRYASQRGYKVVDHSDK